MPIEINTKAFYTLNEVGEVLSLTDKTILRYIQNGELSGVQRGKRWYILGKDLWKFLKGENIPFVDDNEQAEIEKLLENKECFEIGSKDSIEI